MPGKTPPSDLISIEPPRDLVSSVSAAPSPSQAPDKKDLRRPWEIAVNAPPRYEPTFAERMSGNVNQAVDTLKGTFKTPETVGGTLTAVPRQLGAAANVVLQATGIPELQETLLSRPLASAMNRVGGFSDKNKIKPSDIDLALSAARPGAGTFPGQVPLKSAPRPQAILSEAGVQMTPGQLAGGIPRRLEEAALKNAPILGAFVRGAEKRSIESFNKAVINQSLDKIGKKLGKDTPAGYDAFSEANDAFDNAYAKIKGKVTYLPDNQLVADIAQIRRDVNELPPAQRTQFEQIVKQRFLDRFTAGGIMDGERFKLAESDLGRLARQYRTSNDPVYRQLAYALDNVKLAMRANLARSNPAVAKELQSINDGYAMLVRAEEAGVRRAGSLGVFSPEDLLQTIKKPANTTRKDFIQADGLLQPFAIAGKKVLPATVPDSGTTERYLTTMLMRDLLGGGLAYEAGHAAGYGPETLAALGIGSIPYTGPAQAFGNAVYRALPEAGDVAKAANVGGMVGAASDQDNK